MSLTEQQIIQKLDHFGHLRFPFNQDGAVAIKDINKLGVDSPEVRAAIESYQALHTVPLEQIIARNNPQLVVPSAKITGELDDDTLQLLNTARCDTPDYDPNVARAVGSGNWKRCHGIGEFHCCTFKIITAIPDHIAPFFDDMLENDVVERYRRMGLWFKRDQTIPDSQANILVSFVNPPSNDNWIGLAIVGQGLNCTSRIWSKFDKAYKPANVRREWATLLTHEFGHNCGLGHSSGGVMNPYIIAGLPKYWTEADPSYSLLVQRYGGKPIPNVGSDRVFDLVLARRYDDNGQFVVEQELRSNITKMPAGFWD